MEKNKKISEEEIKKILNDNYDIVANQVEEINRGTADIFKSTILSNAYGIMFFHNHPRFLQYRPPYQACRRLRCQCWGRTPL